MQRGMFNLVESEEERLFVTVISSVFFPLSSTSSYISTYTRPSVPCFSRTFCFPGVLSPTTGHTAHYCTPRHLWTRAVLSSPLSDIYHSTVQLRLAMTTIYAQGTLANQTTCPRSTYPQCKLCHLLTDCRYYS